MSERHSRCGCLCIHSLSLSLSLCLGEAHLAPCVSCCPQGPGPGRYRREPHPWCPFGWNGQPRAPVPPGCLQPWFPKPTWSAPPAAQASVLPVADCRRSVHRRPGDVIAGHPSGDKMDHAAAAPAAMDGGQDVVKQKNAFWQRGLLLVKTGHVEVGVQFSASTEPGQQPWGLSLEKQWGPMEGTGALKAHSPV